MSGASLTREGSLGNYGCVVDRGEAIGRLPNNYADALSLFEAGMPAEAIATRLDVPIEAVGPMIRLAQAKLDRLLRENSA